MAEEIGRQVEEEADEQESSWRQFDAKIVAAPALPESRGTLRTAS